MYISKYVHMITITLLHPYIWYLFILEKISQFVFPFWYFRDLFSLFYVHECLSFMFVYARHTCLVTVKVRRGCWSPWNRCHVWLWATIWVLRIEPKYSGIKKHALNCWFISLSSLLLVHFLNNIFEPVFKSILWKKKWGQLLVGLQ